MILVTGASGFVGRSLMRALARQTILAKAYPGRMNDPLALRANLPGVTTVIHLASAETRGRPRLLQHVDVEGSERLVEECRRAGVSRLIFLSRIGADPNSMFPLLRAKGEVERILQRSGIPVTVVQSATLFGRDDRFLNVVASLAAWTWPFVWLPGGGQKPLQPLWVEDLVRCLVALLDRPDLAGQTIQLAGGERLRYSELVRLVLITAGLRRIGLPVHLRISRPLAMVTLGWWRYPPVSRFFLNRFSVPDVADLDAVLRYFRFHPGRVSENIAYLRRPGLRRQLFRPQSRVLPLPENAPQSTS